ncbi:Putative NAD(+)--arginine ADP-ribosyltransferase Vis (Putative mono(ADP-ribosyl)transferase) (mADPRT) (mART) (Toxin Vis) [Durusdinium trenchii]|uniref:NAD(P)(+)--arginine ADP-ribosyltransferase n=1 Tax=Durusdinium trenchii TaxID=1381693 RepID=A0ABP0HFG2_9DINO
MIAEASPRVSEAEAYERGFEVLDKWKHCERDVGASFVFEQNKSRAENSGFPSVMEVGRHMGLSEHEVAAVMGWTTGDFRLINPIARGQEEVEFDDYPAGVKTLCRLHRAEVMPYIYVLNSALQKLPATSSGPLYRGHRREVALATGSVILLPGFTSVSFDMDSAVKFATQANQGRSAKRSLLVIQESFSGRSIAKLSARKNELEVLFPKDTYFEVIKVDSEAAEKAVADATVELQKSMPEAEVKVVYLREIAQPQEDTAVALL